MNLPIKNRDAILWAIYLAALQEWDAYYPNASRQQRDDARIAIRQDLNF